MLIYYDNHIIVTENTMTCGQWSRPLVGPINKIYDVNNFLIICCESANRNIHIYHRKQRQYTCITIRGDFIVNQSGPNMVLIVSNTVNIGMMNTNKVNAGVVNATILYWCNDTISVSRNRRVHKIYLEDDWPISSLRLIEPETFRGHTDIVIKTV